MPTWGRRGSYSAITYTAVALVAVAVFAYYARPIIPKPDPNSLVSFRARFLARAAQQGIDWRLSDSAPFVDAKRLDKPVMVFAGSSACQAARRWDQDIFSNREVTARLKRDFICVRVDSDQEPEWRGAFLPMLRSQLADPGYVLLFFAPDGTLLTWIGRRTWEDKPDFNDFLGRLTEIVAEWRALAPGQSTQSEQEQRTEHETLRGGHAMAVPDRDAFLATLSQPTPFWQWNRGTYDVLRAVGRTDESTAYLQSFLSSPNMDLLDGGVFRLANGFDRRYVEFDKSATDCAEMLAVLATEYRQRESPLVKYWYDRCLEALERQFFATEPWSCHIEEVSNEDGRSPRHSFGAAKQRSSFDADLRARAQGLGLIARDNPLMVPVLLTDDLKDISEIVDKLRKIADSAAADAAQDAWLDASGFVVARVFEAASLMGDDHALGLARQWAVRLEEFRAGTDEVRHAVSGRGMSRRWLGDYVGYADAMFEAYAATGDEPYLRKGEAVLRRALELFTRESPGDIVATPKTPTELPLDMPSIIDGDEPPALPILMSLCFRYGAVLGDKGLRQRAVDIAQRFSPVANGDPAHFASFFSAAQEVMVVGCDVVVAQSAPNSAGKPRTYEAAPSNREVSTSRTHFVRANSQP